MLVDRSGTADPEVRSFAQVVQQLESAREFSRSCFALNTVSRASYPLSREQLREGLHLERSGPSSASPQPFSVMRYELRRPGRSVPQ